VIQLPIIWNSDYRSIPLPETLVIPLFLIIEVCTEHLSLREYREVKYKLGVPPRDSAVPRNSIVAQLYFF